MSTDTFSDLEARLRSDLPRLADALVGVGGRARSAERRPASDSSRTTRSGPADVGEARPAARGGGGRRWCCWARARGAVRAVDHDAKPGRRRAGAGRGRWAPMASSPLSPREAAVSVWTGTEVIIWGGRVGNHGPARRRRLQPDHRHLAHDHAELLGPSRRPRGLDRHRDGRAGQERRRRLRPGHRHLARSAAAPERRTGSFLAPVWTGDRAPRHRVGRRRRRHVGQPAGLDAQRRRVVLAGPAGRSPSPAMCSTRSPTTRSCGPDRKPSCGTATTVAGPTTRRRTRGARSPTSRSCRRSRGRCAGRRRRRSGGPREVGVTDSGAVVVAGRSTRPRTDGNRRSEVNRVGWSTARRLVSAGDGRAVVLSTAMAPTAVDLSTGAWTDTDPGQEVLGGANQSAVWTGRPARRVGRRGRGRSGHGAGWRWHPGG